ncbi:hypothetical protein chiPu_0028624 [Chiloscyllium punctatum]|uniref:Uncharacterized protein n=1 Tax=Chiloscyllium punctatum TaxID=137246 RepID=A0A401TPN0_CHIPU|nr:hypothetical protein [Chiloscyllium punctatum]
MTLTPSSAQTLSRAFLPSPLAAVFVTSPRGPEEVGGVANVRASPTLRPIGMCPAPAAKTVVLRSRGVGKPGGACGGHGEVKGRPGRTAGDLENTRSGS